MSWIDALQSAGDHATRIKHDLPYFSQYLKIRPKVGSLAPFALNTAQLKLHQLIEDQRARTGRVRLIVLKARQLGVSTHVAAPLASKTNKKPEVGTVAYPPEKD